MRVLLGREGVIGTGVAVTKFGLALDDGWGDNKKTVFIDVTCWKQTAEFVAQYCTKGTPVCVDGRLSMDTWEDRQTGQKRSKLYVTANSVQNLAPRQEQQQAPQQATQQYQQAPPPPPPQAFTPPPPQQNVVDRGAPAPAPQVEGIEDVPFAPYI
jgi:single-strand DNA-binding protein